jgi:putative pyruvate formate lyase activating enzyme
MISSANPHFGEERPLGSNRGPGTVFFTHCGMRCPFCQNWDISHLGRGKELMVTMVLDLQQQGGITITWSLRPTVPHRLSKLWMSPPDGAASSHRHNTCGCERLEVLKLLDGVVGI